MADPKGRRTIGICRIVIAVLCVIILAFIIAFAVVTVKFKNHLSIIPGPCPEGLNTINLNPPTTLGPFHDLTREEIMSVKEYLYSQRELNLVRSSEISCNSSHIFTIELHVPNKEQTLNYLDRNRAPPIREATVVLFRGDKAQPFVEEYTIGPLPNPTYKKDEQIRSYLHRPLNGPEYSAAVSLLRKTVQEKVGNILEESYGGRITDCVDGKCLDFHYITPFSSVSSGEPMARKMWFWLEPTVEFFLVHPLDFLVLVDLTSNDINKFKVEKVFYGDQMFLSLEKLKEAYNSGSVQKTKIPYPSADKSLYSSMHRRGKLFPASPLLPPTEFEPSGKRYSINGRHINYMGWDFDVRMSTLFGPQLFDIRIHKERIIYELSLQEIAVFYSANSPSQKFADYVDSVAQIGTRSRSLVTGADCPAHATYLSADHVMEGMEEPWHIDRAFCVFEHNTGIPLRRHLSSVGSDGKFYEGVMDIVLIVRTITTVVNYDYILDFVFHQNGVVEVKAISTGYILTSFRFHAEDNYGFQLRDRLTGNIHHHMFHFKVDMDIHGTKNRFETLEIVPIEVDNTKWSMKPSAKYSQTKLVRKPIQNENDAAIKYNFDTPKYFTFYNNDYQSATGLPRAYRLQMNGMSKQMFPENIGQEPSVSWARYQLAVTKYKESEKRSSSMYAIWDGANPIVNFQKFIADDEGIADEDQVAWISMGIHHIPHMEDLPVTTSPAKDLRFYLLPYNYFDEDPAMGSGDAVRIDPVDQLDLTKGLNIELYGKSESFQCLPKKAPYGSDLQSTPISIFDKSSKEEITF